MWLDWIRKGTHTKIWWVDLLDDEEEEIMVQRWILEGQVVTLEGGWNKHGNASNDGL
jgi:hypothetical protein